MSCSQSFSMVRCFDFDNGSPNQSFCNNTWFPSRPTKHTTPFFSVSLDLATGAYSLFPIIVILLITRYQQLSKWLDFIAFLQNRINSFMSIRVAPKHRSPPKMFQSYLMINILVPWEHCGHSYVGLLSFRKNFINFFCNWSTTTMRKFRSEISKTKVTEPSLDSFVR